MKKALILLIALALAGVVLAHSGQRKVFFDPTGSVNSNSSDAIENVTENNTFVEFDGRFSAPNPCHNLTYYVEEQGNTVNLRVSSTKFDQKICSMVVDVKTYNAKVKLADYEKLVIYHDDKKIDEMYKSQRNVIDVPKLIADFFISIRASIPWN